MRLTYNKVLKNLENLFENDFLFQTSRKAVARINTHFLLGFIMKSVVTEELLMSQEYTCAMYKLELKDLIEKNGYDSVIIAKETSRIFFRYQADINLHLRDRMLDIMTMQDGPEFKMTEEEFHNFLKKI